MYRNTNHIYLIEIIFIESIDCLNTDQPKTVSETKGTAFPYLPRVPERKGTHLTLKQKCF